MDYYENMQKIIDYIENNLNSELDLSYIAKMAHISKFHFHRMFKAIVGDTLMNYIRKRKLINAAQEIIYSSKTILEISDRYLFNSHEVFTRAFKRYFNLTPSELKKSKNFDFYEKKFDILGVYLGNKDSGTILNSKVVEIPAFKVAGKSCITTLKDFQHERSIESLWFDFFNEVDSVKNKVKENFVYGFCQSDLSEKKFKYFASIKINNFENNKNQFEIQSIPKSKYLVFFHKGHFLKILDAYRYIYGQAIPNSGYTVRDELDDFVRYKKDIISNNHDYIEASIHIPILSSCKMQ